MRRATGSEKGGLLRRGAARTLRASAFLAAGLLLLVGGAARAQTVLLADGRRFHPVTLQAGAEPDQVRLDRVGEPPIVVERADILVYESHRAAGTAPAANLELTNGDRFVGEISFPAPRQVRIGTAWGIATIPFQWVRACRLAGNVPLPQPRDQDVVVVEGAGPVSGFVRRIEGERLILDRNGTEVPIDLGRVQGFVFHRPEPPETVLRGLIAAIDLGAGERFTAQWIGMNGTQLRLRLAWGQEVEIPARALSRLEVKNGKLVYLSDLTPVAVEQVGYFDGEFAYRVDQSQSGRPLRLGGVTYRRGLGVHSRCVLTYALDGAFARFSAIVGIDDAVGTAGSVIFRVYGDGRLLYESPVVRGADPPREVDVDVRGVVQLKLEVDYADLGDLADHANWAEARLLRP